MRRPVLVALVVVIALLAVAAAVLFLRYRQTSARYTEMKSAEEAARGRYAEAFGAIAEIQDSLNAIALGDTSVQMLSHELQVDEKMTEPHRRAVLERISVLRASLERNRERIGKLEANLRKSGVKMTGLQRMLGDLKRNLADKEVMVAQLSGRVDSLQTQVTGLQGTVQQDQETIRDRERTIEDKRRELATIFYAVASKSDLVKHGVLEAKGGVLGLGRTLRMTGQFDESMFTALDTDQETIVRTPSAKVQVMSAQPTSSYELQLVAGRMELHITQPQDFRRVKHLVIMTR